MSLSKEIQEELMRYTFSYTEMKKADTLDGQIRRLIDGWFIYSCLSHIFMLKVLPKLEKDELNENDWKIVELAIPDFKKRVKFD